jgi:hypothetical protein
MGVIQIIYLGGIGVIAAMIHSGRMQKDKTHKTALFPFIAIQIKPTQSRIKGMELLCGRRVYKL